MQTWVKVRYNRGLPTNKFEIMKRIAIYDMDGTIVCSLHRYRTINDKIDLQFWRDNECHAMNDSLLPLSEQYRNDLNDSECYVIIATARVMHEPDYQFVETVLGNPDYLISRKNGDSRSGGVLKVLGLNKLLSLKQFQGINDIVFYEDNVQYLKTVCDYFNIRGVYIPSKQGH